MNPADNITENFIQSDVFQKIGDICAAVNVTLTAQELLEVSLDKTLDLFQARRGSIFLLSENGQELILKIGRGMGVGEQEKLVKKLGEGVVGKVAEIKKPLFVDDITRDTRFPEHQPRKGYSTPSFLCAPLLFKDKLIGVINIADKTTGSRFTSNELQILDFLSSQIALNYRRTRLYNKFKRLVKESQSLKDELGKSSEMTSKLRHQVITQEKLASLGKLAGGIAHELNNPLDGVLRFINLSLTQLEEDDPVKDYLIEAKAGLNRMVNIVRSLLACSRNEPPTMKKIHFNDAVNEATGGLGTALYQKNIRLTKSLADNVPLLMDFGVDRVVLNLLRNAIDSVRDGGEIAIMTAFKDGKILFSVADNGSGIQSDLIERIFDPFFTTKDIDKGCGLGLTIVQEIVKSYGGEIDVESAPGKGAIFTVSIPVGPEETEAGDV